MEEKLEKAIEIVLSQVRTNLKPDESLKQSQAVLNLMHARGQWVAVSQVLDQKPKMEKAAK